MTHHRQQCFPDFPHRLCHYLFLQFLTFISPLRVHTVELSAVPVSGPVKLTPHSCTDSLDHMALICFTWAFVLPFQISLCDDYILPIDHLNKIRPVSAAASVTHFVESSPNEEKVSVHVKNLNFQYFHRRHARPLSVDYV